MKTIDGYSLQEGDECWVSIQCLIGEHNLSLTPRKAKYMDEAAKAGGWDFTMVNRIKVDCEEVEVLQVWKNQPKGEAQK